MDPPDATFSGDRELLGSTPSPPMRLERQSEPNNAPLNRKSPVALVTIEEAELKPAVPLQNFLIQDMRNKTGPV